MRAASPCSRRCSKIRPNTRAGTDTSRPTRGRPDHPGDGPQAERRPRPQPRRRSIYRSPPARRPPSSEQHRGGRRLHRPLQDRSARSTGLRPDQILARSCEQLSHDAHEPARLKDLEAHLVEVRPPSRTRATRSGAKRWRRCSRRSTAMVVIRWKDMLRSPRRADRLPPRPRRT